MGRTKHTRRSAGTDRSVVSYLAIGLVAGTLGTGLALATSEPLEEGPSATTYAQVVTADR